MIPVGTLEEFASLDVSAQRGRVPVVLGQPLEFPLLSSSSTWDDDCDQDDDEQNTPDNSADDWGEREMTPSIIRAGLCHACRRGRTAGRR